MLMTRHNPHLDSAPDWLKQNFPCDTTNQKYYLGSDKSTVLTVWNFCSRSSEVTLRGKPVVARVMASYREPSK